MATFVLVHGAWHGGWCYAQTAQALRAMGHEVHCPTLTGLGERSHLAHPALNADAHVQDIANVLEWRELEDVFLLCHSYGGLVVTGAAGQVPERIKGLIYLDAYVPEISGDPIFARLNPERLAQFEAAQIDGFIMPDQYDAWVSDDGLKDWLHTQITPHPIQCFRDGVTLSGREKEISRHLYVLAGRFKGSAFHKEYARLQGRETWSFATMDGLHDLMLEDPEGLAQILNDFAQAA